MNALQELHSIPMRSMELIIFEIGLISQSIAAQQGTDGQNLYLQVQYEAFKSRLTSPQFLAQVKKYAQAQEEQDSSE